MSKTISNKILFTDSKNIEIIKAGLKSNDRIYLVEIDGKQIQSWEDYISIIETNFKLPTPCLDSVDRYLDWMRDLSWLKKEEFILIITNYSLFLKNNSELRKQIIDDFADVILPFWQDGVEKVVVDGKSKSFIVYLVD